MNWPIGQICDKTLTF